MKIQLHYKEKGQGTPLILLHGNGENCDYFQYQMDYFSQYHRVIAIDTRGHGQSPRGVAPFTLTQFALDLLHFLDQHEIPKANILGFSDGGNIALLFALAHPERVNRLILNGANLNPWGVKFWYQLPIILGYYLTSLFAKKNPNVGKKADLLKLMVKEPHISFSQLKELTIPTLVIAGTQDMIRTSHTRLIADNLPAAKIMLIPGDHFIAKKNADAFNQAVEHFLRENI